MLIGKGFSHRFLTEVEARDVFAQGVEQANLGGKRVLLVLPDSTRSGPIPLCFRTLADLMLGRVARLDVLIALGTHIAMDEERLCRHLGITPEERTGRYHQIGIYNHDYQSGLTVLGKIPASEIAELSDGMLREELPVEINTRVLEHDHVMICGPVFPHEIVGFSGGNKYFFPGISGPSVIDVSHWLGALLTNLWTIGRQDTPVREMLDRAAALIPVERSCFSMVVVGHQDLAGLFWGAPELSQAAAAEISARVNIRWMDHPFHTVISVMPKLYDDIWTASKGMYKLEPVVADGGTVIIYAPHIDEISYTHGAVLDRIGYHVRDYYLAQMERFAGVSRGVMTHATLVKGSGTYQDGSEHPRINVVLATGIPRERCERVNLGYMDPEALELSEWADRESEGILLVPRAGEMLHRLSSERATWPTTGG
ncbi:MAG: lactate racemase domain-containing protein [Anaerolineae bacterium]